MRCECGNNEFYATQVLHVDVIISGNGEYLRDSKNTLSDSIYDSEIHGDYQCTACGKLYESLHD